MARAWSIGYDLRHFFASMLENKIDFDAVTCQTFHRKKGADYDIDSFFAPKIAAAFGVNCDMVRASTVERYAEDSERRLALIGTETFIHDWAVPFMKYLAERTTSIVCDGLHVGAKGDTAILMKAIDGRTFGHLSGLFPTSTEYREVYRVFLIRFPANLDRAEVVFLQCCARRCVSPWITMTHPPGQNGFSKKNA